MFLVSPFIENCIEKGNMVGILLCDQSAAFDLCDHSLLKEKLELMDVDVSTVESISSYLSDRKQSCFVDGNLSPKLDIPQCFFHFLSFQ